LLAAWAAVQNAAERIIEVCGVEIPSFIEPPD